MHELHVFNQEKLISHCLNTNADGMAYLLEIDNSRCELYFANTVENQTYLFSTHLTREVAQGAANQVGDYNLSPRR